MTRPTAVSDPVRIGLVGAGRIGTSHATLLARHVPGAELVAVADPRPEAAKTLADALGCRAVDMADLFADPLVEAVVITASSQAHADLIVDGCEASAVISGQDCAASPSVSRTASSLSVDRPASAMRASPPALAR